MIMLAVVLLFFGIVATIIGCVAYGNLGDATNYRSEHLRAVDLLNDLDIDARAEYSVNERNTFAWNVSNKIATYRKGK
jgi:hypothetical protein